MVKQSSIKNFWMIFFGVIALLAIATAVFTGVYLSNENARIRMSVIDDENYYKVAEENNYRRSLYAACDHLKNLNACLGKSSVSSSAQNRVQSLTNAVVHANLINRYLANLPIADSDNLVACQKFVNQTQDYSSFLLKQIADGSEFSGEQKVALKNLEQVAANLYAVLQNYAQSDSGMFVTNGNGTNGVGALSDTLEKSDGKLFAYEKLIYDGPFSDSVEAKTLKCKKISHDEGLAIVQELFGSAVFDGELKSQGLWYCYELENGRVVLACDGRVAEFDSYVQPNGESKVDASACVEIAQKFCEKLGYDVEGVWVSEAYGITYVSCATVKDGVTVYPDLVKVALDPSSGAVLGCDARAYLFNHCNWNVAFGELSQEDAAKKLDGSLKVVAANKCLVEKNNKYFACYEFQCQTNGDRYFVYVDSQTGEEVELFKVVQNTEGYTVM